MRLTPRLPAGTRKLRHELVAFGVIGVLNAVVDFGVYNALIPLGALKANAASTVLATTLSYAMNRRWTFRDRHRRAVHREYVLFFGLNLIGLGIQEAVLGLAKYGLGFAEGGDRLALNLFKGLGVAVATVFRYWSYRRFVFRPQPSVALPQVDLDTELAEIELAEIELAEAELDGIGTP